MAAGATSGSFTALILRLISDFAAETHLDCPLCPEQIEQLGKWAFDRVDPVSLLLGVLIGILIGPLFDLIWIARQSWRSFVRSRVHRLARLSTEPHYKLA